MTIAHRKASCGSCPITQLESRAKTRFAVTCDQLKDSMSILLRPNEGELNRVPAIVEGPLNVSTLLASPSCALIPHWKDCDPIRDSNPRCETLSEPFREVN